LVNNFNETFDKFKNNLDKVEVLIEKTDIAQYDKYYKTVREEISCD
jgi:hypothetical protein